MTEHRRRREAGLYEPGAEGAPSGLDAMSKAELLEYAQQLGVSPANNDMTKAELRAGVEAHLEGAG